MLYWNFFNNETFKIQTQRYKFKTVSQPTKGQTYVTYNIKDFLWFKENLQTQQQIYF